jgi:hypothetical protein
MADDQHPSVTIIPTQHLIGIAVGSRDVTVRSRLSSLSRLLIARLNAGGFLRRPRRRLVRLPLIVRLAPSRSSAPYLAACPEFGKLKKRASGRGVAGAGVGRVTSPVNWRACNWEGRASGSLVSEIRSGAAWPVTSVELQGGGSCPLSTVPPDSPFGVGTVVTRRSGSNRLGSFQETRRGQRRFEAQHIPTHAVWSARPVLQHGTSFLASCDLSDQRR